MHPPTVGGNRVVRDKVVTMDIDEFYEADERRRRSTEIELGTEWRDTGDVRYELNWVEDTGELYALREAPGSQWIDLFGGLHVNTNDRTPNVGLSVAIVAVIARRDDLERILSGWQQAMDRPDSISWVAQRLQVAGVANWPDDGPH
jgi:hypothetical protein